MTCQPWGSRQRTEPSRMVVMDAQTWGTQKHAGKTQGNAGNRSQFEALLESSCFDTDSLRPSATPLRCPAFPDLCSHHSAHSIAAVLLARSRSRNFWIFPVEVFGSGPKITVFGALKRAMRARQYSMI